MRGQKKGSRRLAGLLCLALLAGFVPAGGTAAHAADAWVQPYLDKLVDWGVMRGDQEGNLDPSRPITRAEYVSMINRAYGFVDSTRVPFDDVPITAWYAEDIGIGYRAGYFAGTSDNTAEPEALLTREQATVILGRNLMLQVGSGESLDFSDSRVLSDWSRGMVKTAAEYGMVKGYPDGSFKPRNNITRGEVASLLVSAIGTPINKPGEYSLGDVYGNVTLSSSDVTLKDTVIAGDLYLTGGVGLGSVTLENVTVLGKIIASGAGESNKGESSIILRNVTAPLMVVDAPGNQFVTLRAEGTTKIDTTSVRTPSYLEDTTDQDLGLSYIELDGESGTTLQIAGNIKEVLHKTPTGRLVMARGSANVITVDEHAVGGSITVDRGGHIKDLRLDVATSVTGQGDIGKMTASAGGSSSTILPDQIVVRPGVKVDVSGEDMDTVTASESSEAPRLLAGYPRTVDIAPTSADLLVGGNKKGTIYWAVSTVSDGSVGEDDLFAPPSYASKILKSGNIKADISGQEYQAKVSGLIADGGYYLSAMLVDARGQRSPVKVSSFGTPNDSVPNFAPNYPIMTRIDKTDAQMTVMTTKDCRVYYALMIKGSTAPTPADFKAGALSGNMGFGTFDVIKNNTYPQKVNSQVLKEVETYDLYVWLNDIDGAKSSAVKKINFTTKDMTNPEMTDPLMSKQETTAIGMTVSMNEAGNIAWVVLKAGAEYPKPMSTGGVIPGLDTMEAKIQVSNGAGGVLKNGNLSMTADKEGVINISGLTAETVYDFYCVAVDKAGNYSAKVVKKQINTLDPNAPKATIEFTKFNGTDNLNPTANTDIRVVFNEIVQTHPEGKQLTEYYDAVLKAGADADALATAKNELGAVLGGIFTMYDLTEGEEKRAPVRPAVETNWIVDYREAKVALVDGKTVVTLENGTALDLRSGSTYRLDVQKIADISRNAIGTLFLPDKKGFTTVFAQVNITDGGHKTISLPGQTTQIPADFSFTLRPIDTEKVDDTINWDMIIWSDSSVEFELYRRVSTKEAHGPWEPVMRQSPPPASHAKTPIVVPPDGETPRGVSLRSTIMGESAFEQLNVLKSNETYEYVMSMTKVGSSGDRTSWSGTVKIKMNVVAGRNRALGNLAARVLPSNWDKLVKAERSVTSVGNSVENGSDTLTLEWTFKDTVEPKFVAPYPKIIPSDSSAILNVMVDRPGTVYCVVAPVNAEGTSTIGTLHKAEPYAVVQWADLPKHGGVADANNPAKVSLSAPAYLDIVSNRYSNIAFSAWKAEKVYTNEVPISITGLKPSTNYYVYFVLKGDSDIYSEVQCYGFTTKAVVRPILDLTLNNPSVNIWSDRDADANTLLVSENSVPNVLEGDLKDNSNGELLGNYETMSLWEAIQTNVPGENNRPAGSVFDVYASDAKKEQVANYIRASKPSGDVVQVKPLKLKANEFVSLECKASMMPGTQYLLLVVAKSPLGSGDAFRAIRPVMQKDNTPPMVSGYGGRLTKIGTTNNYLGYVRFSFSEALYMIIKEEGKPQRFQPIVAAGIGVPSGSVSVNTIIAPPNGATLDTMGNNSTSPLESVQYKITNIGIGEVFSTYTVDIGDSAGNSHHAQLTIKLTEVTDAGEAIFSVTPVWDGTGQRP